MLLRLRFRLCLWQATQAQKTRHASAPLLPSCTSCTMCYRSTLGFGQRHDGQSAPFASKARSSSLKRLGVEHGAYAIDKGHQRGGVELRLEKLDSGMGKNGLRGAATLYRQLLFDTRSCF
ncbi:hypothetical protein FIBSPDRAFT_262040 [Athelia psychrophila]|uniref:Secreted protein n=1 Tax=Athelia psychrophila TaxID=1759441 RepID=A0A165XEW8_9AGAM|nr:hypothetical protein FIBSPDRAFT_262040 [Fibularhizoctonia sp. CBS 109695]